MGRVPFVSTDVHKKSSRVAVMNGDAEILAEDRISHEGRRELAEFFASLDPGTDVLMEATFNWPWGETPEQHAASAPAAPSLGRPGRSAIAPARGGRRLPDVERGWIGSRDESDARHEGNHEERPRPSGPQEPHARSA